MLFVNLFSLVLFPLSSLLSLERKRRKSLFYGNKRFIQFFIASKFIFVSPRDLRRFLSPPEYATSCSRMVVAQRSRPTLVEYAGESNLSTYPVRLSG